MNANKLRTLLQKNTQAIVQFGSNPEAQADYAASFFVVPEDGFIVNGEALNKNDILIGSNAAGQGNLYYFALSPNWFFRIGTTIIFQFSAGGTTNNATEAITEQQVILGSGDINLDITSSLVRIVSASGDFRIKTISTTNYGASVEIFNDTAHKMTIANNAYAGAAPAGYAETFTLTGADLGAGTFSAATFRLFASTSGPVDQWLLKTYRSSAGAL